MTVGLPIPANRPSRPPGLLPPAPTLHRPPLRALMGEPCEGVQEVRASFQPFTRGFLLWLHERRQLFLLHASGEFSTLRLRDELPSLGEPLAPAERVPLQLQRCQGGSLIWTPRTGLLLCFHDRWLLPFEVLE